MEGVVSEYVQVRGILSPEGDVPWRRFRTTQKPRVLVDDPQSSIQVVQHDGDGRERKRWGLPTRLVDTYGSPDHQPDSEMRVISGTFPLYRSTERLVVEYDYGLLFELDVPAVRPRFREPLTAAETDGGYRFSWEVEPGTNRELVHDVLASPDGGTTWECLVSDLEDSEVLVRESVLEEGRESLIAVETWDGFYTATERGRIRALLEPELEVRILHPRRGRTHRKEPVLLEALTFVDGEIEAVPDECVRWFVGEKQVASGTQSLWSQPESGIHDVKVEVEYRGTVRIAKTRVAVDDEPGEPPPARKTGT